MVLFHKPLNSLYKVVLIMTTFTWVVRGVKVFKKPGDVKEATKIVGGAKYNNLTPDHLYVINHDKESKFIEICKIDEKPRRSLEWEVPWAGDDPENLTTIPIARNKYLIAVEVDSGDTSGTDWGY